MAGLFMDIFELSVLTFMFVRQKNSAEFKDMYGPHSEWTEEKMKAIEAADIKGYINEKEMKHLMSPKKAENGDQGDGDNAV